MAPADGLTPTKRSKSLDTQQARGVIFDGILLNITSFDNEIWYTFNFHTQEGKRLFGWPPPVATLKMRQSVAPQVQCTFWMHFVHGEIPSLFFRRVSVVASPVSTTKHLL
jgi:hypothetical protein